MLARPSVDGLEHTLTGRARFARVDATSPSGQLVADRYDVRGLPTYLLVSPDGRVLYRQVGGRPDGAAIERALSAAR